MDHRPSNFINLRTAGWIVSAAVFSMAGPAAFSQVTTDWVEPVGGVSVAVDAANNVYTVNFEYNPAGDITLTKRDVNGHLLWEASFDQTDRTKWDKATWVTVDHNDEILVSGTVMSGYSNPVSAASILMKFDRHGTLLWRQVYESSFDGSYTRKCLVDAANNVYVLGMGSGPAGYVCKIKAFDPAGVPLWTWHDDAGIGAPVNFKWSPDGFLLVSARAIYGALNGYAKVDLSGSSAWSLANVPSLTVGDAAGDASGSTYVVHGEHTFGGGTTLKKLDPAGVLLWEYRYSLAAFRVEVGNDQQPVFCGFPDAGTGGAAFWKVDSNGNTLWSNLDADGSLSLLLHAQLLMDKHDAAYLAAGTLFDMAVCKVNSDGTSAWTALTTGSYANAIVFSEHDCSVFVAGGSTARLIDETRASWTDLGLGLAGTGGIPLQWGEGDLTALSPVSLHLEAAAPGTGTFLVFGTTRIDLPFLGGTLVPSLTFLVSGLQTDANGRWHLSGTWPSGIPSGTEVFVQTWALDSGAPRGFAASNAVRLRSP